MNDLCEQLGYDYFILDYTSTGDIRNGYDSIAIRLLALDESSTDKSSHHVDLDLFTYVQKKELWSFHE